MKSTIYKELSAKLKLWISKLTQKTYILLYFKLIFQRSKAKSQLSIPLLAKKYVFEVRFNGRTTYYEQRLESGELYMYFDIYLKWICWSLQGSRIKLITKLHYPTNFKVLCYFNDCKNTKLKLDLPKSESINCGLF